jgi:hypothetical protein
MIGDDIVLHAVSPAKHCSVRAASTHCESASIIRGRMTHECLAAHASMRTAH